MGIKKLSKKKKPPFSDAPGPITVNNAAKNPILSSWSIGILFFAFFLSGISGLIHEVAWTRVIRHVMGVSTLAVTTVLTVFMAGLAIGSFLAGRFIERRKDPLRVFAFLEVAIGLSCLVIPIIIEALTPAYGALYRLFGNSLFLMNTTRLLYSSIVLLPTAILMGATLPVLVRFFARKKETLGQSVGRLYAINTLGAAVGAGLASFVLLPALGLMGTIWTASALNFLIFGAALTIHTRLGKKDQLATPIPSKETSTKDVPARRLSLVLFFYAFTGFSSLAYEVAWTRVLTAMVGSSVYAFGMILTAFITGLGFGSLLFSRWVDRLKNPIRALAFLQLGISATGLMVIPFFSYLPFWFTALIHRFSQTFWLLHLSEFLVLISIMLIPTLLMGASFPLMTRIFAGTTNRASRSVGSVYSVNTVGAILGAFSAGFLLLPFFGIQNTLFTAIFVNGVAAIAFAIFDNAKRLASRLFLVAAPIGLLVVGFFIPPWNPTLMYFGSFNMARTLPGEVARSRENLSAMVKKDKVLFHEDGVETTVTVKQNPMGEISLLVNGKTDASSSSDLPTQVLLAHVPLLIHPHPKSILVIGLASGITLGSASRHSSLSRMDCAEISSAVLKACELFSPFNYDVLKDPRLNIVLADGRNHLALSGLEYDVIVSEPSNPWIAGVADLYTREFFTLSKKALTEDGILCVWLEGYSLDKKSFQSIVRTFLQVFPEMMIWNPMQDDYMLIGAKRKFRVELENIQSRLHEPGLAGDLAKIGVIDAASLLGYYLMGAKTADRFAGPAKIHTDNNALVEFTSPKAMTLKERAQLFNTVGAYREAGLQFLSGEPNALAALRASAAKKIMARGYAVRSIRQFHNGNIDEARRLFREAALLNREDPLVVKEIRTNLSTAKYLAEKGNSEEAMSRYRTIMDLDSTVIEARLEMGRVHFYQGNCREALGHLQTTFVLDPSNEAVLEPLASLLASSSIEEQRDPVLALELANRLIERHPRNPNALRALATALAANGKFAPAIGAISEAIILARQGGGEALIKNYQEMRTLFQFKKPFFYQCR